MACNLCGSCCPGTSKPRKIRRRRKEQRLRGWNCSVGWAPKIDMKQTNLRPMVRTLQSLRCTGWGAKVRRFQSCFNWFPVSQSPKIVQQHVPHDLRHLPLNIVLRLCGYQGDRQYMKGLHSLFLSKTATPQKSEMSDVETWRNVRGRQIVTTDCPHWGAVGGSCLRVHDPDMHPRLGIRDVQWVRWNCFLFLLPVLH